MHRKFERILLFALLTVQFSGCGGLKPTLSPLALESGQELLFVEGKSHLFKMNSSGGEVKEIMAMGRSIQNPVWSPDGESVAMFLMDDKDFDPFKTKNPTADLVMLKLGGIEPQFLGNFEFKHSIDRNGWQYARITRPVWHPDGKKIFVQDKKGLHLVVIGKKIVPLIRNPQMYKIDIALTKAHVVFSVKNELFVYNFRSRKTIDLAGLRPALRQFLKKKIEAVRFSPDENFLAIASGKNLLILDTRTLHGRVIHRSHETMSDVKWNPAGTQLAVLAGKYASYSAMRIGAETGGKIPGNFTITCVGTDGKKQHLIYQNKNFSDGRETSIEYSSDGKWLTFLTSTPNDKRRAIFIASAGGQGWMRLRGDARFYAHNWRPENAKASKLIAK